MAGWGTLFGTIAAWFPKKEEKLRNEIDYCAREMDKISAVYAKTKMPLPDAISKRYYALALRLRRAESALKNRA